MSTVFSFQQGKQNKLHVIPKVGFNGLVCSSVDAPFTIYITQYPAPLKKL